MTIASPTPTPRPIARCDEFIFCRDPQVYDEVTCKCINPSPVIIDVKGDGFELTDAAGGVKFDIDANGFMERVAWTKAGSDDGFLFLDRNGNGVVDNGVELFGNVTPQGFAATPNGFVALALLDQPGVWTGNRDGLIDSRDEVFPDLRIWQDRNHNGVSEPTELHTLQELEIESISLAYKESRRVDRHGNEFRYRAKVVDIRHSPVGRWAWDVLLVWSP
ncbi:MAG TPA: hypothetical protein VGV59_15710 [Pyrinomonadaceae bacterium]|nr:hypothetical protein [Pyrinomonadaceae bacterium]